jgi:membrane associated rhomboid family serine protease
MLPLRDRLRTRRVPYVNYLILTLNILVFMWERTLLGLGYPVRALLMEFGLVPAHLLEAPVDNALAVLSSMFMHDPSGWLHIGGNMLFLWIFGDNVEDAMGHVRYAVFYLLSGFAAAAAQILIDPHSTIPMVGASGAIAGVLAAYGSLYPRSPITLLNPIPLLWFVFGIFLELPAWIVIAEFFLLNLWNGLSSLGTHSGGVAFFAHLGGFVAGLFLVRVFAFAPNRRKYDPWDGFRPPRARASRAPTYTDPRPPRRGPWDW